MLGDTDASAIRRSLTDPRAFRAVFERHFDAVYRFARPRVGGDLADEIAAETFARAFDHRARYDLRQDDARPWLFEIVSNLARRHWRDERRRLAAYGRVAHEPSDRAGEGRGLSVQLADALDRLAPTDREALLLLAWGALTYEEIAIALGVPVGTVRSRIFRARRRMRDGLRPGEHRPDDRRLEEASDVRP